MKKNGIVLVSLVVLITASVLAYSKINEKHPVADQPPESKLSVVTSFYPLYFFTKEITGETADVYNLTPAGVEPHDYELTTQDRVKIGESDLLVINGAGFEPWAAKLLGAGGVPAAKIVNAGQELAIAAAPEEGDGHTHGESSDHEAENLATDPHVWLSPVLAKQVVAKIKSALSAADPKNAGLYAEREEALLAKLDLLNESYRTGLAECKEKNIVTSHAAFHYLAAAYGLNQVSIAGLSPEAEPSAKELAELADFMKKNNTPYIFFESLAPSELADTLAREVGAKTLVLNPLEGLTPDQLGQGENYFTQMQANLKNLRTALDCK